jgi:uncharacterized LabA/DUF88 family protein
MKKYQPVHVFIDGKYLQLIGKEFKLKKLFDSNYDINQFANTISKNQSLWCQSVHYYTAPPFQATPPTPSEKIKRTNYDKFINKLKKIPNFLIFEGRCQKVNGDFHQKGVDTLLTMGLMELAIQNKGGTIILIACDTDFVPVLNFIRKKYNIKVILYYYNDYVRGSKFSMSNEILTACDKAVLIEPEFFKKSILVQKNN